jgi:hypothetical protein
MQGGDAPEGIISAMDRVAARVDDFDLLCILREVVLLMTLLA